MLFGGQGRVGLAGQGLGGGPRVGGRGTGPRDGANFATCVIFLWFQGRSKFRNVCRIFVVSNNAYKKKKNCVWGGGGNHRSWRGGRGVDQGPWLQERVGGGGLGLGCSKEGQVQGRVGLLGSSTGGGKGSGGIQGLRFWKGRCVIFRKLEG